MRIRRLFAPFRYGLALFLGVLIAHFLHLTQGFWVTLTAAVVLQNTLGATLRKGLQRFLGTLIGVFLGGLIVMWVTNPYIIDALLLLTLFIAYYAKACNGVNYGIFVVPLSMMVVMLVSAVAPHEAHALIYARFYDTCIGAVLALFVSVIVFPVSQKKLLSGSLAITGNMVGGYLNAFRMDSASLQLARECLEDCLTQNRNLYADAFYEIVWMPKTRHEYKTKILAFEKLAQILAGLENLFLQAEPAVKIQILKVLKKLQSKKPINVAEAFPGETVDNHLACYYCEALTNL